jgi:hypothetical protein
MASAMPTPTAPPPVNATTPPDESDFPNTNLSGGPPPPQPGATFAAQPGSSASPGTSAGAAGVAPGDVRVTADRIAGNAKGDMTAQGHVHITTDSVDVTGDQAVYTASDKTVRMTGHVHFVGADGDTATATSLAFHTDKNSFAMYDVAGQTSAVSFQGSAINGYVYYRGQEVDVEADGRSIIRHGWITTCSLDHVAYHITGKEIEIRPHDRVIAHSSALYLGSILAAALGIVVLPLSQEAARHQSAIAPRVGYNSTEGFFARSFINFYRSPSYYGTYHVDYFQKVGIGLGMDVFFARADGRGNGYGSFYTLQNNAYQRNLNGQKNSYQASLNVSQMLGHHVTGALQFSYTGQSVVASNIPSSTTAGVNFTHAGAHSTTSYVGNLSTSGPSNSVGASVEHTINFTPTFSQTVGLQFQGNTNTSDYSRQINFTSDTRFEATSFDGDLVIDTSHGEQITQPGPLVSPFPSPLPTPMVADTNGFQKVPELTLHAHPFQISSLRLPVEVTVTDGIYNDQFDNAPNGIKTSRLDLTTQVGSAFFPIGQASDVTATATFRQDAYGTGDLLGTFGEDISVRTLFGTHADNTLSYNMLSVRGYTPMPSFDSEFGTDNLGEVLNVYNGSKYHFSASTSYDFHQRFLSPVAYDLLWQPTTLTSLMLGTTYDPHGASGLYRPGYSPLNITLATPVGKNDYFQMQSNYDFKLHGLQNQSYFITHTVENCYQIRVAYRQPLREVDFSVNLLAFPTQSVNFGINSNGPIVAQSFGQ